MSKHVAVLMGGWSAEREVSLRSGRACAEALTRLGYRVTRIDVGRDIASVLTTVKPDVALNVLHGRPGEDGTLQGILEILAIPYTHSGVMASAVAMQKDIAKVLFRAADVPVPEGIVASRFAVLGLWTQSTAALLHLPSTASSLLKKRLAALSSAF
jgi:D-alanine-D-alanine ligase